MRFFSKGVTRGQLHHKNLNEELRKCNVNNFGHQKEFFQANQMEVKGLICSGRLLVIGFY